MATKVIIFFLLCLICKAEDIYVAQSSAGGDTGADCANAHSLAWLNDASNWGAGAGKVSAGDTVHLCGRFDLAAATQGISALGSGTTGNPITILFETGAILSSPQWGNSASAGIMLTNCSYVDVDGGVNGVIQGTNNGTGLAYAANSSGVYVSSGSYINIRRLMVTNIYVNNPTQSTGSVDTAGSTTQCIYLVGNNDHIRIYSNDLAFSRTGVRVDFDGVTVDNLEIDHNFIHGHCWQIMMGTGTGSSIGTSVSIHDNTLTDWNNWFYPGGSKHPPDVYHTDGIFVYQSDNSPEFAPLIYNNYIYGDLGDASPTAMIYASSGGAVSGSFVLCSAVIYNNLIVFTNEHYWSIATGTKTTNCQIYNNTVIGLTASSGASAFVISGYGHKFNNNLLVGFDSVMGSYNAYITNAFLFGSIDNNLYFNVDNMAAGNPFSENIGTGPTRYFTMAAWKTLGNDVNSITNNPLLNSVYSITSGSPAIGLGTNLNAIFTTDRLGKTRGTLWDIGAYEYQAPSATAISVRAGVITHP